MERHYRKVIEDLKRYADACLYLKDRETLFHETRRQRRALHAQLAETFSASPEFADELGLDPALRFEVHELRRAMRVGPDGRHVPQVIVALTQSRPMNADRAAGTPRFIFRGGSTLIVDLSVPEVKYSIVKNVRSKHRLERSARFVREWSGDPLRALLFSPRGGEPFAVLHSLADELPG
jgi:hypothetical protein